MRAGTEQPANSNGSPPLRIGVSSCLLGVQVRFDGQHKREPFCVEDLAPYVSWVSVCPEVEVGMGVPREPVRLVRGPRSEARMVGNQTGTDWTDRMNAFAERKVESLARANLDGYILKAKSPSCGMERVNLYVPGLARDGEPKPPGKDGVGLFAAALLRRFPNLPVEEEGRLHDPVLRENFIERVFAYQRLRALFRDRWSMGAVVAFHTAHKLALLAHSVDGYRALGRLVAEAKKLPRPELRTRYEAQFMATLTKPASRGRHANVLNHMAGHLRGAVDAADRRELATVIDDYRRELVPLVVPITLIRHHARRHAIAYLLGQTYLDPHPKELMLRNRV